MPNRQLIHNMAFFIACENGQFEIAKELYSPQKYDIHAYDEEVFREACRNGHFKFVNWLITLDYNHYYKLIIIEKLEDVYKLLDDYNWDKRKHAIIANKFEFCLF